MIWTLQIVSNDISELQKNQATTVAKIAQYKRKLMDLSHRVLQVRCAAAVPSAKLLFSLSALSSRPLFWFFTGANQTGDPEEERLRHPGG